jgi:hypothetical protein
MGFLRRVVRKSARKATPRPIRRAVYPVHTTMKAATSRPVQRATRTAHKATHPIATAENRLIDAALDAGRPRRR